MSHAADADRLRLLQGLRVKGRSDAARIASAWGTSEAEAARRLADLANGNWQPSDNAANLLACEVTAESPFPEGAQVYRARLKGGASFLWEAAVDFDPLTSKHQGMLTYKDLVRIHDVVLSDDKFDDAVAAHASNANRPVAFEDAVWSPDLNTKVGVCLNWQPHQCSDAWLRVIRKLAQ